MARILVIAYTNYAFDGRVKRQAEALKSVATKSMCSASQESTWGCSTAST